MRSNQWLGDSRGKVPVAKEGAGALGSAAVGRLAQWLAQMPYTHLVGGSSPSAPTIFLHTSTDGYSPQKSGWHFDAGLPRLSYHFVPSHV